jgi:hypothetical protein
VLSASCLGENTTTAHATDYPFAYVASDGGRK